MARLLDPKKNGVYPFTYTPSVRTNVAETIAKAKEKQKEEAAQHLRNVIKRKFSK